MGECNDCGPSRRDFLTGAFGGIAGMVVAGSTPAPLWAQLMTHRAKAKACILLYMSGGQSQLDTWDPKPGKDTAGPLKSIPTSVAGIHLSQNLPKLAKQMKHLVVIRSMTTSEGSHERARYLIHTGYKPNVTVKHPGMGSIVWNELGDREFELPQFVAVGGGGPRMPDSSGRSTIPSRFGIRPSLRKISIRRPAWMRSGSTGVFCS